MKEIIWDSTAKATVQSLPKETKREIGVLLLMIQKGFMPNMPQSRKMPTVHPSAFELRIKDTNGNYRIFYVLLNKEIILIPHVFTKKTQKTPKKEIENAKKRIRRLINEIG